MDRKKAPLPRDGFRRERVEATAFLHDIVETADRLRAARDFTNEPALRFDRQWTLLREIERCGCCPTFSDVGRLLRITRQSARVLVLAAERLGLVELFTDPCDRRVLQVALTPRGRQTLDAHRMPPVPWMFTLLNGLEPAAMRSAAHVLAVMRQRLERYEQNMKRRPR
jgi:DNA-binding MarR family transcriptional regulator